MIHKNTFNEKEAAAYLGLSTSTLRQSRLGGKRVRRVPPPPFIKCGRAVRYLRVDLENYLQSLRVDRSATSA